MNCAVFVREMSAMELWTVKKGKFPHFPYNNNNDDNDDDDDDDDDDHNDDDSPLFILGLHILGNG